MAIPCARRWRWNFANFLVSDFAALVQSVIGPRAKKGVSIDPTLKDAWGIPAIRVTYKDHPDDLKMAKFLQDRAAEIMDAAGAKKVYRAEVSERGGGTSSNPAPAARR